MDALLDAFVHTASEFEGSILRLEGYASKISRIPSQADLRFSIPDFEAFMSKMRDQGYPAIHHSEIYTRTYQPAYRVVAARLITPILKDIEKDAI